MFVVGGGGWCFSSVGSCLFGELGPLKKNYPKMGLRGSLPSVLDHFKRRDQVVENVYLSSLGIDRDYADSLHQVSERKKDNSKVSIPSGGILH